MVKITVKKKELIDGLAVVNKPISKKHTIPVEDYAAVTIKDQFMLLSGKDSVVEVTRAVPCVCDQNINFLMDSIKILDLIKKLPDEEIGMSVTDKAITIESGDNSYKFPVMGGFDDYSPILITDEDRKNAKRIELPGHVILDGIESVKPFIINDELRPFSRSVMIKAIGEKFLAVSCNMLIFAEHSYPILGNTVDLEFNLPVHSFEYLKDLSHSSNVTMITSKKKAVFSDGVVKLTIMAVESSFPDYTAVFNSVKAMDHVRASIPVLSTRLALERASILADKSTSFSVATLRKEGGMEISCFDAGIGSKAFEKVDTDPIEESMHFGLHAQRMITVLKNISSPYAILTLPSTGVVENGAMLCKSPIIIEQEESESDPSVIMVGFGLLVTSGAQLPS